MIKKQSIDRFENQCFKAIVKPFFESHGFKFKKNEGIKKIGGYQMRFTCYCTDRSRGVYFNPASQQAEIYFTSYLGISHPAFFDWFKEKFGQFFGGDAKSSVAHGLRFAIPVDISQLAQGDFFTFIDGNPLNGLHQQDLGLPYFSDLTKPDTGPTNWPAILEQTAALADFDAMYAPFPGSMGYFASLLYRDEREKAKPALQQLWELCLKKYQTEERLNYKQAILGELELIKKIAKQEFDIDFTIAADLEWKSVQHGASGHIPSIHLSWEELYTLQNLPNNIYRSFLRENGELMTFHTRHNGGEMLVWDVAGTIKHHKLYEQIRATESLGYLPAKKAYFVANFLLFENGETAYLPIPKTSNGNGFEEYDAVSTAVVYDALISNYILCTYQGRYDNIAWFFDDAMGLVKQIPLKGRQQQIYPDKQWIVGKNEQENTFTVYDYNGHIVHSTASRNPYHLFLGDYRWLVTYGYYSQSEVYDLTTGKQVKIYGHPTHVDNYKEHYTNVEHNFHLAKIALTPDGKHAIGTAAHGKWVLWDLPGWKRREIIPNAAFIAESIEPYFFEINGEKYFVNNGQQVNANGHVSRSCFKNQASDILFLENGKFCLFPIREKLVVFNDQFEHIDTYKGLENSTWRGGFCLSGTYETLRVCRLVKK